MIEELCDSIEKSDIQRVKELVIEMNADVNARDIRTGNTPFHIASKLGNVSILRILIDKALSSDNLKEALESKNEDNQTPLHLTTINNHYDASFLLLYHGSPPNMKDDSDDTPLQKSVTINQNEKLADLLLSFESNVNTRNIRGWTPLHNAVIKQNIQLLQKILDYGGDIQGLTNGRWNCLHLASYIGNVEIIRFLLCNGINEDQKNEDGNPPIYYAKSKEIEDLLNEHKISKMHFHKKHNFQYYHHKKQKHNLVISHKGTNNLEQNKIKMIMKDLDHNEDEMKPLVGIHFMPSERILWFHQSFVFQSPMVLECFQKGYKIEESDHHFNIIQNIIKGWIYGQKQPKISDLEILVKTYHVAKHWGLMELVMYCIALIGTVFIEEDVLDILIYGYKHDQSLLFDAEETCTIDEEDYMNQSKYNYLGNLVKKKEEEENEGEEEEEEEVEVDKELLEVKMKDRRMYSPVLIRCLEYLKENRDVILELHFQKLFHEKNIKQSYFFPEEEEDQEDQEKSSKQKKKNNVNVETNINNSFNGSFRLSNCRLFQENGVSEVSIHHPFNLLSQHIKKIFNNPKYPTNFTIIPQQYDLLGEDGSNQEQQEQKKKKKKSFGVHRVVLYLKSEFFRIMFNSPFSETVLGKMKMEDINEKTLFFFLQYLYQGSIDTSGIGLDVLMNLYIQCEKYFMKDFEKICKEACQEIISRDNGKESIFLLMKSFQHSKNFMYSKIAEMGETLRDTQNMVRKLKNEMEELKKK